MTVKPYLIPAAIIIGALAVAAAIFFKDYGVSTPRAAAPAKPSTAQVKAPTAVDDANAFRSSERRLYGNPSAPVTIVEFSDLECPFCARLHATLKQVIDESDGQVNWEYRHLPLPMHENARPAAIAAECVARLKDTNAFWQYLDVLFANVRNVNAALLKREAGKLGLTAEGYDACITDPRVAAVVDADAAVVFERFGQQGTPFSLVVNNKTDTALVINGAQPKDTWEQAIVSATK